MWFDRMFVGALLLLVSLMVGFRSLLTAPTRVAVPDTAVQAGDIVVVVAIVVIRSVVRSMRGAFICIHLSAAPPKSLPRSLLLLTGLVDFVVACQT